MQQQIASAMLACGIDPPSNIIINGEIHRFGKDKACWYIFFSDPIAAGAFGDWRESSSHDWRQDTTREFTQQDRDAIDRAKAKRDELQAKLRSDAKTKAQSIWHSSEPAKDHPYLAKKDIKPHGTRLYKNNLVIPLLDNNGDICSLQFISADCSKRFLSDGQVKDCYYKIGKVKNNTICIAEGFATAASIHEATGYGVVVAFNAGKLPDAAVFLRSKLPDIEIIICADADLIGIEKATLAASLVNGQMIHPDTGDFNDLHRSHGLDAVRKIISPDPVIEDCILDIETKYRGVDLLQFVDDNHILKKLSNYIAESSHLPASTVFLTGLGVFSSIAARKYSVAYQDGEKLPLGLYVVAEQPSGAGKSRCLKTFQKPFYAMASEIFEELESEYKKIMENGGNLTDDEKVKVNHITSRFGLLDSLFTTNATSEGLESILSKSHGFFSAISSEQGLFNVLFGGAYKGSDTKNNNDVALNGFDAGYISSVRVTRKGYCGNVVGGIVCFAQSGSIETLLNSSEGSGLSERFLMLAEPHSLGKRDHLVTYKIQQDYLDQYAERCRQFSSVLEYPLRFEDNQAIPITETGFVMIKQYLNSIEEHLIDGGKYSHASLRGAASKINMQIMKVAANLFLMVEDVGIFNQIDDKYVESAIKICDTLMNASLDLCHDKGVMGQKAEYKCILRTFEDNPKPKLERTIIETRSRVSPFKEYSGNKSKLIRETLKEMVDQKILKRTNVAGIIQYTAI